MTDDTTPTETADRTPENRPDAASSETDWNDTGDEDDAGDRNDAGDGDDSGGDRTVERLTTALNYAVLAGLLLLALVAAVQLYLAVSRTITTFVVFEYRAPVLAAFNLVVLLLAALGVSVQLRRLAGDGTDADA